MTGIEEAALVASLVTTVAGTAVSTIAAKNQADYQASVAKMNAKIEAEQAKRDVARGYQEAQAQDRRTAAALGEQASTQSGSGLSASSASFALARKSARELGRLDTLNVMQDAYLRAYNSKVRESQYKADASAAKAAGNNAILGGVIQGAGQIAGGIGSYENQFGPKPTLLTTKINNSSYWRR